MSIVQVVPPELLVRADARMFISPVRHSSPNGHLWLSPATQTQRLFPFRAIEVSLGVGPSFMERQNSAFAVTKYLAAQQETSTRDIDPDPAAVRGAVLDSMGIATAQQPAASDDAPKTIVDPADGGVLGLVQVAPTR